MKPSVDKHEGTYDLSSGGKGKKMILQHEMGVCNIENDVKRKDNEIINYLVEQGLAEFNKISKLLQKNKGNGLSYQKKQNTIIS